jgi:uncharacterized DUF497 family protein
MEIEFDPDKEATNLAKHKISLRRGADITVLAMDRVVRNGEVRLQVFGIIDNGLYCFVFTFRPNAIRAISLRGARMKELLNASTKVGWLHT